jgi:tricorn protease-like protein
MLNRSIKFLLTVLALALLPAVSAAAAGHSGAVVFSRAIVTVEETKAEEGKKAEKVERTEGGLYAARDGRLNQLTEDPTDSEPDFSADGRKIAFVRAGDVWSMRADGTGQHKLTSGSELDSRPQFDPKGRYVVFTRTASEGASRDLYRVNLGGAAAPLVTGTGDEHEASFSPDGKAIVFVRGVAEAAGGVADDVYSVRPSGGGLARLTKTGHIDEFSPRYFKGGIVFSRGQSGEGPGAYADIFTMRRNGSNVKVLVAGAGSSFVEDVAPAAGMLLFRRDRGLWTKKIGPGRAHKLSEVADNSKTNSVFSSDGRKVAAFIASKEAETLSAIDVASRRGSQLAEGFALESGSVASTIGSVMTWQPVRR